MQLFLKRMIFDSSLNSGNLNNPRTVEVQNHVHRQLYRAAQQEVWCKIVYVKFSKSFKSDSLPIFSLCSWCSIVDRIKNHPQMTKEMLFKHTRSIQLRVPNSGYTWLKQRFTSCFGEYLDGMLQSNDNAENKLAFKKL